VPHPSLTPHISQRGLVLEDLRIVFVPVPKAACTSMMWLLAELAGLERDHFESSPGHEVSPEMTIHDMKQWPSELRLVDWADERLDDVLQSDDWLRFTVVRNPFRRLFSAWQSKVMLAEPQFVGWFADRPWFGRELSSPEDLVSSFRAFLDALGAEPGLVDVNPHWSPQVGLLRKPDEFPFSHVGRAERLPATLEVLRRHVEALGRSVPELGAANVTPVPYVEQLFEEAHLGYLAGAYADDLAAFDYAPLDATLVADPVPESWLETVRPLVPALNELRLRNLRIGGLHRHLTEARADLRQASGRVSELRTELRDTKVRLRRSTKQIEVMKADRAELRELRRKDVQQIDRLRAQHAKARRQAERFRRQLEAMRTSRSWRVTRPLRRVRKLLVTSGNDGR
jgi:hypothetical protein